MKLICLFIIGFLKVTLIIAIQPDAELLITELVSKYGYPIESHQIRTEDGYLLTLHRIPYGRKSPLTCKPRPPVLLMHGLLASSISYVNYGPNKSLAFLLADSGYDVWLGNQRGNFWGRKHISIDPDSDPRKFFNFSLHEIGVFDMPAKIDYILDVTGHEQVYYLGYSQGCAAFFIMCSERPEYNYKIKLMIGLAPAVYLGHMRSPVMRTLAKARPILHFVADVFGIYEVFRRGDLLSRVAKLFCTEDSPFQEHCITFVFLVVGFDSEELDRNLISILLNTLPSGASMWQFLHFAQFINTGNFSKYDHGAENNLIHYGQRIPPLYDLKKTTAPVILHSGRNDFLVTPKDVEILAGTLPNLVKVDFISLPSFNHLDHLWAIDVVKLLYNDVIEELKINSSSNI